MTNVYEGPWIHGGLFDKVSAERAKQVEKGYTAEHDDTHTHGDIGLAAACYATPHWLRRYQPGVTPGAVVPQDWPWNPLSWQPEVSREKEIVKAIALLVAEYERLEREPK